MKKPVKKLGLLSEIGGIAGWYQAEGRKHPKFNPSGEKTPAPGPEVKMEVEPKLRQTLLDMRMPVEAAEIRIGDLPLASQKEARGLLEEWKKELYAKNPHLMKIPEDRSSDQLQTIMRRLQKRDHGTSAAPKRRSDFVPASDDEVTAAVTKRPRDRSKYVPPEEDEDALNKFADVKPKPKPVKTKPPPLQNRAPSRSPFA